MPWQIAAAGVSALGNMFQQQQNKKMMREQMAWNTKEREASQAFTTSERLAQQGYQTGEREAQNDWSEYMYNQYQSPQALRDQYSAAGLNPALAISGSAAPAASSGSSGSAPSGASSHALGYTPPYQDMNSISKGFAEIGNALSSLADAKQKGVETDYLEQTLKDRVKQESHRTMLMELGITEKDLQNKNIRQTFENLVAEMNLKNANIDKIRADIDYLKKRGVIEDLNAKTFMERFEFEQNKAIAETDLADKSARLREKEGNRIEQLLPFEKNVLHATELVHRTQAALNRLATGTEMAKASYYSELSSAASYDADIKKIDAEISKAKEPQKLQLIDKQVDMLTKQLSALDKAIEKAQKENDWFVLNQLRGLTKDVSTSIYMLTQIKRGQPVPAIDIDGDSSIGLPYN